MQLLSTMLVICLLAILSVTVTVDSVDVGPLLRFQTHNSDGMNVIEDYTNKKPAFCHGLDCPGFKVLNKTKDYELREYEPSRWVSTRLKNYAYDDAVSKMFRKLFNYIQGDNVEKEKIDMTAPVINHVIPGAGPACVSDFVLSFYIAPKVTDPPAPSNRDVFLSNLPKQKVYVSSFGGRAYEKDWLNHGDELATALMKDNRKFEKDYFYTAGYDSPFRLFFRHNEIWFIAKD